MSNDSINLIAQARRLQLLTEAPVPTALDTLATAGAHLAKAMDLLQQPQIIVPAGNLLRPVMVRLNADGARLPDKNDADPYHVATLLPQYGLIVDAKRPEKASSWQGAKDLAANSKICGVQADGLLTVDEWGLIIDRKFYKPAVNKKYFPNMRTDDIYWTASECADPSLSDYAWYVSLYHGGVSLGDRNSSGLAVGCRRVSPSQ